MSKKAGRTFPVDPNLPRWVCQNCRHSLCIVGVDSYAEKFLNDAYSSRSGMQGSSTHGAANSMLASTRMDNSFVVLPKQRPQSQGIPPRPRTGAIQADTGQTGKGMDESFVVVYKNESPSDGGGTNSQSSDGGRTGSLQPENSGFHSTITVLKRAFEIATTQTQVEQPLCLECMRILSDKLDKEVEDVSKDIEAYEVCLKRLEGEARDVLSEADFLKEKLKVEEEERKILAATEETDRQFTEVNTELKELEKKSIRFKELEDRYWHEFNNFQFQLISHQEERDGILAKIEVSQAHLELLKRINVLNDAFPIWHDGEFGTINNFRLGRLPKIQVEWDEINAAWGQACLLLHTMCQYFRPRFQYRIKILPMGSYPRIVDANNSTYELLRENKDDLPLNLLVKQLDDMLIRKSGRVKFIRCTRYDKAMTLYLTCLKEFAEFANSKDQENNIPLEKCFKLPYKIENDKVENYSITQSFNKQENWTKALKYTLCDLKWALYWFVGNTNFQPLSTMVSTHPEAPSAAVPLNGKRNADLKSEPRNSANP